MKKRPQSKETSHNAPKRLLKRILICFIAALALFAAGTALFVYSKLDKLNYSPKSEIDEEAIARITLDTPENGQLLDVSGLEIAEGGSALPESRPTYDKSVYNILLLGTDQRVVGLQDRGRADSIILCSINLDTAGIKLISFERAIGVPIPGHALDDWLTHSFAYGGAELTTEIVSECFSLDIDAYVHVDFEAFKAVIDALGGVDVEIEGYEAWYINEMASGPRVEAGLSHLNGNQALAFCRFRKYGGGDWKRTERQRNTIQAIINKAKDLNLFQLNSLANEILPLVNTNLRKSQILYILLNANKFIGVKAEQMIVPESDQNICYKGENYRWLFLVDFNEWAKIIDEFIYG